MNTAYLNSCLNPSMKIIAAERKDKEEEE